MGLDLVKLSEQGRAYSAARPWTEDELEAVLLLERERHLSRIHAADHVRNGIMSLEDFDKATKKKFVPKTLEQAHEEAEEKLKERGKKAAAKKAVKKVAKKKQ